MKKFLQLKYRLKEKGLRQIEDPKASNMRHSIGPGVFNPQNMVG